MNRYFFWIYLRVVFEMVFGIYLVEWLEVVFWGKLDIVFIFIFIIFSGIVESLFFF